MFRTILLALIFAALALTLACVSPMNPKMQRLDRGMSSSEVKDILGKPDGYREKGDRTFLQYSNRVMNARFHDTADYFVVLEDDQVVEYGAATVRESGSSVGGMILIPAFPE